jgi:hypothetical protein
MNDRGYVRAKECSSCRAEKENSRNDTKECISCQDRQKEKIFEILRVRNRFVIDEGGNDRSSGGYRDISFKIKVGFQVHILDYCSYITRHMQINLHIQESSSGIPQFLPV